MEVMKLGIRLGSYGVNLIPCLNCNVTYTKIRTANARYKLAIFYCSISSDFLKFG